MNLPQTAGQMQTFFGGQATRQELRHGPQVGAGSLCSTVAKASVGVGTICGAAETKAREAERRKTADFMVESVEEDCFQGVIVRLKLRLEDGD